MSKISAKRVMSGTWGFVYVDTVKWAEASAASAKVAFSKETVQSAGAMMVGKKLISAAGTGSITMKKVYSRLADICDSALEGIDPKFTIIMGLDDPDAYGAERVALYDCSFDDLTLMDYKVGALTDITLPFTYESYEYLEQVDA